LLGHDYHCPSQSLSPTPATKNHQKRSAKTVMNQIGKNTPTESEYPSTQAYWPLHSLPKKKLLLTKQVILDLNASSTYPMTQMTQCEPNKQIN
jgi:hypothetical protein